MLGYAELYESNLQYSKFANSNNNLTLACKLLVIYKQGTSGLQCVPNVDAMLSM